MRHWASDRTAGNWVLVATTDTELSCIRILSSTFRTKHSDSPYNLFNVQRRLAALVIDRNYTFSPVARLIALASLSPVIDATHTNVAPASVSAK